MNNVGNVTTSLAPMMACVRPYAPEAGGLIIGMGGWDQNYILAPRNTTQSSATGNPEQAIGVDVGNGLVRQHYGRALAMASTTSNHSWTISPAQFAQISGKQYAMPRPPGLGVGQPWFLPSCGVTPAALDPSQDPEAGK
jgi:hypothetical protein